VDKQLKVSWVAPSASHASATAVVSYTIACRGSASCPATLANVDKSLTTHTFTGLTNGDQYSFQVMALDKDGLNGTSAWSPPGVPSCGSGVLEFSAASYDVVEGKVVVLTVLRRAGAAGFVQVSVNSLVPGVEYAPGKQSTSSATVNSDYSAVANSRLVFSAGTTEQTLQFATLDDDLFEVDETVMVQLSEPSGGAGACRPVVGTTSPTVVVIADNGDRSVSFTQDKFQGVEGTIIQVNATLQSVLDISANFTEIAVNYLRDGLPTSELGGKASWDVDFVASTSYGELTFHGAYTPSDWLADNRTFELTTKQDVLGEDNEGIIIKLAEPKCYCSLVSTFDSRDATLDGVPLVYTPQTLMSRVQQQVYALNGSFWNANQTTAQLMRACSDTTTASRTAGLSKYEDAVELLLDRTNVFVTHHQGMAALNADAFTISVATTPEEANEELSSAPFATGAGTPEFYGLMRVPLATCQESLLVTPAHGSRSPRWNHYPVNVTFSCKNGFSLQGGGAVQCLSNGSWSGPAPTCITNGSATHVQPNASCSQPPSPGPFGFVTLSSANMANYTCAEGTWSVCALFLRRRRSAVVFVVSSLLLLLLMLLLLSQCFFVGTSIDFFSDRSSFFGSSFITIRCC
jgi:hypothetical protein